MKTITRDGERYIHEDALRCAIANMKDLAQTPADFNLIRDLETCLK